MNLDRKAAYDAALKLKKNVERMSKIRERLSGQAEDFKCRYRSWCLAESEAEWSRGFRFVRMVQDNSVGIFFDFIEPLTRKGKKETIIALSKRMHWEETMSKDERDIFGRYRQHWSMPLQLGGQVVSALRTTPHQLELQERFFRNRPNKGLIAKSLREALKGVSGTALGTLLTDKPSVLGYEKQIGHWYVVTAFELLGPSQLSYAHHIHALSGGRLETSICGGISILNWTGIHIDTTWSWLLPEDVPSVVKSVRKICVHFIGHAAELLRDLRHDLS